MSSDYDKLNSGFTEVVDFVEPGIAVPEIKCTKNYRKRMEIAEASRAESSRDIWRTLLRNNLLALIIHLLLGGSLLMLMFWIPEETFLGNVFGIIALISFVASLLAIFVYPMLGAILLKPLSRGNFLSVLAPIAFLIAIALIDFLIVPLSPEEGILTGGFNHIALCSFCHALGPGMFLWKLNDWLLPLTGLIGPAGDIELNPLTMLIAALYPSLLLYLGIRIRIKRQKVVTSSLCRCADCQSAIQEHESEV